MQRKHRSTDLCWNFYCRSSISCNLSVYPTSISSVCVNNWRYKDISLLFHQSYSYHIARKNYPTKSCVTPSNFLGRLRPIIAVRALLCAIISREYCIHILSMASFNLKFMFVGVSIPYHYFHYSEITSRQDSCVGKTSLLITLATDTFPCIYYSFHFHYCISNYFHQQSMFLRHSVITLLYIVILDMILVCNLSCFLQSPTNIACSFVGHSWVCIT